MNIKSLLYRRKSFEHARKIPTLHFNLCRGGTRSNSLSTHNTHEKKPIKVPNGRQSCLGASWQRRDTNVMEHTCDFGVGEGARARHRNMSTVRLCSDVVWVSVVCASDSNIEAVNIWQDSKCDAWKARKYGIKKNPTKNSQQQQNIEKAVVKLSNKSCVSIVPFVNQNQWQIICKNMMQ